MEVLSLLGGNTTQDALLHLRSHYMENSLTRKLWGILEREVGGWMTSSSYGHRHVWFTVVLK